MTVYVDAAIWKWLGLRWCHLVADDLDELHRFAASLGVRRTSYQGPPKTATPHYDITAYERGFALRLGASACGREEIVVVARLIRRQDGNGRPPQSSSAAHRAEPSGWKKQARQKKKGHLAAALPLSVRERRA